MPRKTKETDGKIEDVKKKKTSSTRKKSNKKIDVKRDKVSSFKEALQMLESIPIEDELDAYIMYVSQSEKEYATTLAQYLRMNGYRVDMEYMGRSLKSQFKQADRLKSKHLIILNEEEMQNDVIKIKDNKTKEETLVGIDYILYYFEEKTSSEEFSDSDLEEYLEQNEE